MLFIKQTMTLFLILLKLSHIFTVFDEAETMANVRNACIHNTLHSIDSFITLRLDWNWKFGRLKANYLLKSEIVCKKWILKHLYTFLNFFCLQWSCLSHKTYGLFNFLTENILKISTMHQENHNKNRIRISSYNVGTYAVITDSKRKKEKECHCIAWKNFKFYKYLNHFILTSH